MKLTILKRLIFGYATIMLLIVFLGGYVSLQLNKLNRFHQYHAVQYSSNFKKVMITQSRKERKGLFRHSKN